MDVRGFHHVNVRVEDLDRATAFYRDVLGLHCRNDVLPDGAWFDMGIQQLHLTLGRHAETNGQHFAIVVSDVRLALEELRTAGTTIVSDRDDSLVIADPDGNLIEVRGG